ncbi:hypothetical protein V6Z12_D13G257500 [Gossypium hirsutum]
MARNVWNTATRLFIAVIGTKLSCIRHDLHSLKKEAEKVEIVLVGLPPEFNAVLTLASFSSEPLPLQRLIDVLLEYESR